MSISNYFPVKWKPEVKIARQFIYTGVEHFYPMGRYSMAPVIAANRPYLK